MVILVPMVSYLISYTKKTFVPKVSGWLENEFKAQIRYGYSYSVLTVDNDDAWANIKGDVPIKYSKNVSAGIHPLQKVQPGWK